MHAKQPVSDFHSRGCGSRADDRVTSYPDQSFIPWHLTMAPKSISASSRAVAEAQISQAEQHMKTPDPVSALPLYEAAAVVLPRAAVAAGRILLAGGKIPVDRNAAIAHFRAAKTNRSNAGALELSKCLRSDTDRSKRDESIIILRELMTKNVLEAQFQYANVLCEGALVPADVPRAIRLFANAAQRGHYGALVNAALTASRIPNADEQTKDAAKVALTQAARLGHPRAQYNLAIALFKGVGQAHDPQRGLRYMIAAADAGDPHALITLGMWLVRGEPVAKDVPAGLARLRRAAAAGVVEAHAALGGILLEHGPSAYAEAERHLRAASDSGHSGARVNLALTYLSQRKAGDQRALDYEAFSLLCLASERGSAKAMYNAGLCLLKGRGTAENHPRAFDLFKRAARCKFTPGLCQLGICYEEGMGTEVNKPMALKSYEDAAKMGDPDGQRNAARCYEIGTGAEIDWTKAERWLRSAAGQGDEKGMRKLAEFLQKQPLLEQRQEARDWLQRAVEMEQRTRNRRGSRAGPSARPPAPPAGSQNPGARPR